MKKRLISILLCLVLSISFIPAPMVYADSEDLAGEGMEGNNTPLELDEGSCPHDYVETVTEPSCETSGYTTYGCLLCDDSYEDNYVDALGHSWDEGVETAAPTATEPGLRTYTCTLCGAQQTEEIPATGEREPVASEDESSTTTAEMLTGTCGDNLTWILDGNGTLTISGTGDMNDYGDYSPPRPWDSQTVNEIIIESGVTSIGNCAFYGCKRMTNVDIPEGVTSIGNKAFQGCYSLTNVHIPAGVTSIGDLAFCCCYSLTNVNIPAGVRSIGYYAFAECSSLTSVNIPDGVTSIGYYAFAKCSGLTSVSIPDSVTSIEDGVFSGCSSLTSVDIPDGLASIGDDAFGDCSSLKSVDIPEGVTSLGGATFYNCSSLTSVSIPAGVTSIGKHAFYGCRKLTDVYYAGTEAQWDAVTIDEYNDPLLNATIHFGKTIQPEIIKSGTCGANLTWTLDENGTLTISGTGDMSNYHAGGTPWDYYAGGTPWEGKIINEVIIKSGVTSIGHYAFDGCSGLISADIPGSVTSIGSSAFGNCSRLTSVDIPETVTSIGVSAFINCNSLKRVSIPEGVTSIKDSVFAGCSSLTSVDIPKGVTTIGSQAFYNCSSLTSVDIPKGVTTIGSQAFHNCSNLTGVILPEGMTSINAHTFNGCSSLTSVDVPESVASIGNAAFSNCSSLTSISIPKSVTSIGSSAFYGCNSLKGVYISDIASWCAISFQDNPLTIAENLYLNNELVTELVIPEGVTSISAIAFQRCSSLTSVRIPTSVTSIGNSAFSNCSGLTSVSLPEGITSIAEGLFGNCRGLESVCIPASVTVIGRGAFNTCINLKDVYYSGTEAQWNAISIGDYNEPLLNANNIHFNWTASPQLDIRCYTAWNEREQRVYFGPDDLKGCLVTEETDSGFRNNPTLFRYRYVIVETKKDGENEILLSMNVPKSSVGTITNISSEEITIDDDQAYPLAAGLTVPDSFIGNTVLYHVVNYEIVRLDILQENTGHLFQVDSDASLLFIRADKDSTDYGYYYFSPWLSESDKGFLNLSLLGLDLSNSSNKTTDVDVNYLACKNNLVYEIRPVVELREGGFSAKEHGWSVLNTRDCYGYSDDYYTPHWMYHTHGTSFSTVTNALRKWDWNGNCFGLSLLAVAQYNQQLNLKPYFSQEGDTLNEFGYSSVDYVSNSTGEYSGDAYTLYNYYNGEKIKNTAALRVIEQAQVSMFSPEISRVSESLDAWQIAELIDHLNGINPKPLVIGLGPEKHAVVTDTSIKPIYIGNDSYLIPLYDSNAPYAPEESDSLIAPYYNTPSMLAVNVESGNWSYIYNWGKFTLYQSEHIISYDTRLVRYNIHELDNTFFDAHYSFDSDKITVLSSSLSGNFKIYLVNLSTEERTLYFEQKLGLPVFIGELGEYRPYYEGAVDGASTHKGIIILPMGNYIIETEGECYFECMYDNNIFVVGADNGVNATLDVQKDTLKLVGTQPDTKVSCIHASSEVDFSTSVEASVGSEDYISLSTNSEDCSAVVKTNMSFDAVTMQHAIDGELVEDTSDMIHSGYGKLGDVTLDGLVESGDALQIQRYVVGLSSVFDEGTEEEKAARLKAANVTAAVDGDDLIESGDALQIQRYIVGLSSVFDEIE